MDDSERRGRSEPNVIQPRDAIDWISAHCSMLVAYSPTATMEKPSKVS
jgi:hypothetical protein